MRYQPRMQGSVMPGAAANPHFNHPNTESPNTRILGYLGRALSLEFSAGQHYLAQASLSKFRQETNYAQDFIKLANEEFQHANLITDRLVSQGALPSGSVLSPSMPAHSIAEALRSCEARELALIDLYGEAAQFSANVGAGADQALFARLLEEEQSQLVRIHGWLEEYYQSMSMAPQPARSFV